MIGSFYTINLNRYFNEADSINSDLTAKHQAIIKTILSRNNTISESGLNSVKEFLEKSLYAENSSNNYKNALNSMIQQKKDQFQEIIDKNSQNLVNNYCASFSIDGEGFGFSSAIFEKKAEASSRQKIHKQQAKNLLQQAQKYLDALTAQNGFSIDTLSKINSSIEKINQDIQNFAQLIQKENDLSEDAWLIDNKKNQNYLNSLKVLDAFINSCSPFMPNNQEFGSLFEELVGKVYFEKIKEIALQQGIELTEEFLKEIITGSQTTERGGEGIGVITKVISSLDILKKKYSKVKIEAFKKELEKQDIALFEYENQQSNVKKQMKMDIHFNWFTEELFGKSMDLRISAKNWNNAAYFSKLGETTIGSAMDRTLNNKQLYSRAIYALQNNVKKDYAENSLDLIHLSCLADIVTGYSQQAGFANVLVINDNNGGPGNHIKIFSMAKLFKDIKNNFSLDNFNRSDILNKAIKARKDQKKNNIPHYFYIETNNLLASQKVSVVLQALKK